MSDTPAIRITNKGRATVTIMTEADSDSEVPLHYRAADALADRSAQQDPLAVRLSKRVFHLPREAHPHVDEIAQAILFESEAKFERMQAFLDRKKK